MKPRFESVASGFPDPFRLMVRERAASTNDDLRQLARDGAPDGLVLLALEQTAGRGRRGAAWHSVPGEALALSILVRPEEPPALWPRLALATGLAVAETIESFGPAAGIKWPNDVWIGHRKIAGILVEGGPGFAIVGIGLNVNNPSFPPEIAEIATSLRHATGREIPPEELLAVLVSRFARRCRQIGSDFGEILGQIRQRCVLTGETVSLRTATGESTGTIEGIGDGGELLLRTSHGVERIIQADEVRIRNAPRP